MQDIYAFLKNANIPFERIDHPAVFTCEESAQLPPMPGADTKNLFLRDKNGKRHVIVSVPHGKRVDVKALSLALDARGLSFASPDRLRSHLGVEPGSVTLLGLIHDPAHAVEVVIDRALWDADAVCCHPLVNTATLVISHAGLEAFLETTGHKPVIIDVPEKAGESTSS